MWESEGQRLVLLELLALGKLKRRVSQAETFDVLRELPWTRATGRRDEIGLVEARRHELVALIERVWPEWRDVLAELTEQGYSPTPEGWGHLLDVRRSRGIPELPVQLNRRTAAAISAPHSKATLTERRRLSLGETEPVRDGAVRLRPPVGLVARTSGGLVDLAAVAAVLGEVVIPERAFLNGLELEGAIRAVLLVENLGAWRDLPELPGWLLAHVPGWDTTTAIRLIERMPGAAVVHFGDLDPNGVRIYLHLKERRPDLRWFLPAFWFYDIETYGLRARWPAELDLGFAPPQVRDLAARGLWLEQERIVVDARIAGALEATLLGGQ